MSTGPPSACSSDGCSTSTVSSVLQKNSRLQRGVQERASDRREPSVPENNTGLPEGVQEGASARGEPSVPENNTELREGVQETASARLSEKTDEVDELIALLSLESLTLEQTTLEEDLNCLPAAIEENRRPLGSSLSAYLLNVLSVDNCVVIYQEASQNALHDIEKASHHVICKNFLRISETNEAFTDLPLEYLSNIVFSHSVCATEEQVFRAIVRWVMADQPMRQRFFKDLVHAVRVNRCPLKFLEEMLEHFLVQTEPNYRRVVQHRIRWATSERFDRDSSVTDALSRTADRNIIFVMGGTEHVNAVETLDPVWGSWVSHNIPDAPRNRTWICSMGQTILVLEDLLKKWRFRSFDVQGMKWTELKTPPCYRNGTCKAYSEHHVYILGGKDPYDTRCYGYDAHTNEWKKMALMVGKRDYGAAACFEGKLYCCGGADASVKGIQKSLEVLDLQNGGPWSYLPVMQIARFNHSLVSCGRYLWAIGGFIGRIHLSSVERYDVEAQEWSFVGKFMNGREDSSMCVFDRRIYVIGGKFERTGPTRKVDKFNEEKEEWIPGVPLNTERFLHGSCVVKYMSDSDADRYTVPIE